MTKIARPVRDSRSAHSSRAILRGVHLGLFKMPVHTWAGAGLNLGNRSGYQVDNRWDVSIVGLRVDPRHR